MAALTAEEWRFAQSVGFPRLDITVRGAYGTRLELHGPPLGLRDHAQHEQAKVHQIAALALHGQPFGFSWDDVDALIALATHDAGLTLKAPSAAEREQINTLMDRLVALLPPRE